MVFKQQVCHSLCSKWHRDQPIPCCIWSQLMSILMSAHISVASVAFHWPTCLSISCCLYELVWSTIFATLLSEMNNLRICFLSDVIGIYDFIDRSSDVERWNYFVECLTTGFHILLEGYRAALPNQTLAHQPNQFQENWEFDTSDYSGLNAAAVISSKYFLVLWQIPLATGVLYGTQSWVKYILLQWSTISFSTTNALTMKWQF